MANNANIGDEWVREEDFARANGISQRAVARMRAAPNGLPYAVFAKRIIIHLPTAREWLQARMVKPNPRRSGGANATR